MRDVMIVIGWLLAAIYPAWSGPACPNNPDAIGTSRTIAVDPLALPRIGMMQYKATLPLEDHEVVLTFDDGPLPPYTNRILDTLAANCVRVTYFLVGEMADAYPALVRRIYNAGHVIGTHSQTHPLSFNHMTERRIAREVDNGIGSVTAALGDPRAVAPFFRIPGLARGKPVETYLAAKSLAVWSADEDADDWHRGITPKQIVRRAIRRIEAHGHRGVLLLHDIHSATATALPMLLNELKGRGYSIVQAVPTGDRPASVPELRAPVLTENTGHPPDIIKAGASPNGLGVKAVKAMHHYRKIAYLGAAKHKLRAAKYEFGLPLFWRH